MLADLPYPKRKYKAEATIAHRQRRNQKKEARHRGGKSTTGTVTKLHMCRDS